MQGRPEHSRESARPFVPGQDLAHTELYQIQRQVVIDRGLDSSWIQLFKKPSYRKRAFLGMGTTGVVQFAGVLVINSKPVRLRVGRLILTHADYGPVIYGLLGYNPEKRLLFPAIWVTFGFGLFLIAPFLIDLFPRNRLLSFGMFGCACTLIVEAALIARFVPSHHYPALKAAVAMFYIYQLFYAICLDGWSPRNSLWTFHLPGARNSIHLSRRILSHPPSRERDVSRNCHHVSYEYHLAAVCPDGAEVSPWTAIHGPF